LPATACEAALLRPVRAPNRCRVVGETNRYAVPPAWAGQLLTLKLYADRRRLFAGDQLVAEHLRSYEKSQDSEQPDHVQTLLHERGEARHQRLLLAFLGLSACAPADHAQRAERRLNLRHQGQEIVALAEIYRAAALGRALDDAHVLGAYSCEYTCRSTRPARTCSSRSSASATTAARSSSPPTRPTKTGRRSSTTTPASPAPSSTACCITPRPS